MKTLVFMLLCLLLFLGLSAMAVPVDVTTASNPDGQDPLGPPWTHELGVGFPLGERISASDDPTPYIPCPRDYRGGGNVKVTITNLSA